jgi:hypothetical protein
VKERAGQLAIYVVELSAGLSEALEKYAAANDVESETIIAEAVRAYLGDR